MATKRIHARQAGIMLKKINAAIKDPKKGLPEEVFLFISGMTPMINVDLLIKDKKGRTLLTWRDDGIYPPGWHIPGGIIRSKETITERINAVADGELGANVKFEAVAVAMNEVIHPSRRIRGHFISLLYKCRLTTCLEKRLEYKKGVPAKGQWAWHAGCPDDLIEVQGMYKKHL